MYRTKTNTTTPRTERLGGENPMEEWRRGWEAMGCLGTYPDRPELAVLPLSHPGERETLGEQALVGPIKSRMEQN